MIQALYEELTLFNAISATPVIPAGIYYISVPIFSVLLFVGIYRDATVRLDELVREGGNYLETLFIFSPPLECFVFPKVADVIEATRKVT